MSTVIRVSAEHMNRDGESIAAGAERIASDINGLAEAMKDLGACWEGPAWEAFQDEVGYSMKEMQDICDFFAVYLEELADAGKVYRRCETANRNRIRSVRI